MQRHDALIPLSHAHQHALANALRLRRSAAADHAGRQLVARAFLEFVERELQPHMRQEEQLLERARAAVTDQPRQLALDAHAARVHEDHVRYEERTLFQTLQDEFGDELVRLVAE
jgi:hypothetical protein